MTPRDGRPVNLKLCFANGDSFACEGDHSCVEALLTAWYAQRGNVNQAEIDALTKQLDAQNAGLRDAVTTHTPPADKDS